MFERIKLRVLVFRFPYDPIIDALLSFYLKHYKVIHYANSTFTFSNGVVVRLVGMDSPNASAFYNVIISNQRGLLITRDDKRPSAKVIYRLKQIRDGYENTN